MIYQRSLTAIEQISVGGSQMDLMLGLGESDEEVEAVMYDLREVGCEILSLGQFLSPSTRHLAVERWVPPETFERLAEVGRMMGFSTSSLAPWYAQAIWRTAPWIMRRTHVTSLNQYFPSDDELTDISDRTFSEMALNMASSRILVIAYAVRERIAAGAMRQTSPSGISATAVQCAPELKTEIKAAIDRNETNYPPAHGTPELRSALRNHYRRDLNLDYPEDAFVVASGRAPFCMPRTAVFSIPVRRW